MIRGCHAVTSGLVHTMLDRARTFTSVDLHESRFIARQVSAGLAHGLNNPASAIQRSARREEPPRDNERAGARGSVQRTCPTLACRARYRSLVVATAERRQRSPLARQARGGCRRLPVTTASIHDADALSKQP
jgi:hypothetical protein